MTDHCIRQDNDHHATTDYFCPKLTQSIQINNKILTILNDINLDIYAGEQVAITGRSGSGKSTF
jgi:ABC-type lipoprotein export system ATPase subunit